MAKRIPVDDVKFDKEFYPRFAHDKNLVEKYKRNLDELPPITVREEDHLIIDGYHRLLAYRFGGREEIEAEVLDVSLDEARKLSVELNASHGQQLSMREKRDRAREWYKSGFCKDLDEIADRFKVDRRTAEKWTERIREKEKDERNQEIMDMWLACHTQEEIAEKFHIDRSTVAKILGNVKERIRSEIHNDGGERIDCLKIYDVWRFERCDPNYGEDYRGRLAGQIVKNLLYYFTEPFDLVVDPMAGGGTTVDVCKEMYRRWLAYDIKPFEDKGIEKHDILDGFPEIPVKQKPKLVLLDPPYWQQYSEDGGEWWNDSLDKYLKNIQTIFRNAMKKMSDDGYIALIITSTRKDGRVYDLPFLCYEKVKEVGFSLAERISTPYCERDSSSGGGAWQAHAKENKYLLRNNRDLMVFGVDR